MVRPWGPPSPGRLLIHRQGSQHLKGKKGHKPPGRGPACPASQSQHGRRGWVASRFWEEPLPPALLPPRRHSAPRSATSSPLLVGTPRQPADAPRTISPVQQRDVVSREIMPGMQRHPPSPFHHREEAGGQGRCGRGAGRRRPVLWRGEPGENGE